jgi:hypothetical protein
VRQKTRLGNTPNDCTDLPSEQLSDNRALTEQLKARSENVKVSALSFGIPRSTTDPSRAKPPTSVPAFHSGGSTSTCQMVLLVHSIASTKLIISSRVCIGDRGVRIAFGVGEPNAAARKQAAEYAAERVRADSGNCHGKVPRRRRESLADLVGYLTYSHSLACLTAARPLAPFVLHLATPESANRPLVCAATRRHLALDAAHTTVDAPPQRSPIHGR